MTSNGERPISVAVVGGGIGGIAAATMLRREGYQDVTVFERNAELGGVWHTNTYPGAACDVPSHFYEFSFAPNPDWSRRYAPQAEIKAYLERVVRDHGVESTFRFDTNVRSAAWDKRGHWVLDTSSGEHVADVLIAACGQLSTPKYPDIDGLEAVRGPGLSHRAVAARRRPDRQARGCHRQRMQRGAGRPGNPASRFDDRCLPTLAGLDDAPDGLRVFR